MRAAKMTSLTVGTHTRYPVEPKVDQFGHPVREAEVVVCRRPCYQFGTKHQNVHASHQYISYGAQGSMVRVGSPFTTC